MDQGLQVLNTRSKMAEWAERITECRNSGQSVRSWCLQNGISEPTYYKWQKKLTIFGDDYPTPDGTCQRDYLHVVDLAVGHLKALEYAKNYAGVEAINLGTGSGISVLELVHAFNKANDMELPYVIGPRRDGDLAAFWADASKAKRLLGWEAAHTVADMCRSAWHFAKNQ